MKDFQEKILNLAMKKRGTINLDKPLYPKSWNISKINATYFNEQFVFDKGGELEVDEWNTYVERVTKASGAIHWDYCEWVEDSACSMIGILNFENPQDKEFETEHFERWGDLFEHLSKNS